MTQGNWNEPVSLGELSQETQQLDSESYHRQSKESNNNSDLIHSLRNDESMSQAKYQHILGYDTMSKEQYYCADKIFSF